MFGPVLRVAVTSSLDRADGMAAELVAVGLRPVKLPCVHARRGSAEDIARMRAASEEVDLIVLDSLRPLDLLWPDSPLPPTPFAASSRSVAAGIEARRGVLKVVGDGRSLEFATSLLDVVSGKSVALPHASDMDPRAIVTLADAAGLLVAAPVYANHPKPPAGDPVDAAVFLSPAAVHGWALRRSFTGVAVAALDQRTREELGRYGRRPDVQTASTAYSDLSLGLAGYLA